MSATRPEMTQPEATQPETTPPRARYRSQVRAEIKEHAWSQIASAGASALSLNAIAKQMGMTGPALYRYFASRDDLITELVTDAYRSLAAVFHAAAEQGPDLAALAHAMRGWALEDPQRYMLIYGTPVPGYHAPPDVTAIAAEIMTVLLDACADIAAAAEPVPFDAHLEAHRAWDGGYPTQARVLRWALTFWTRMQGVLSLELAGHFTGMEFDPAELFEAELASLLAP
jgi:AcrR family transcriptional regulator